MRTVLAGFVTCLAFTWSLQAAKAADRVCQPVPWDCTTDESGGHRLQSALACLGRPKLSRRLRA